MDHCNRWREDLDLLAGAGLTAYRFSLEWNGLPKPDQQLTDAFLATGLGPGGRDRRGRR